MRPYYEHAGITIYHGDCREILPHLSGDLLLTDPPYGINFIHGGREGGSNPTKFGGVAIVGDDSDFDPAHLLEFSTVIIWGANHFASRLPDSAGWFCWDKRCNTVVNDQSDCELAWTKNISRTARIYYHVWDGFRRQTEKEVPRVHPTQKPVALMQWCICKAACLGIVIDPYMGSGSTLIAARLHGNSAIGIEIEEKYCEIAAKRLSQEVFDFKAGDSGARTEAGLGPVLAEDAQGEL